MSAQQSQDMETEVLLDAVSQAFNNMQSSAKVLQSTMRDTLAKQQQRSPADVSVTSTASTGTQTDRSLTLNASRLDHLEKRLRTMKTIVGLYARSSTLQMADRARIVGLANGVSDIAGSLQFDLGQRLSEIIQEFATSGMADWVKQERRRVAAARSVGES